MNDDQLVETEKWKVDQGGSQLEQEKVLVHTNLGTSIRELAEEIFWAKYKDLNLRINVEPAKGYLLKARDRSYESLQIW
ncbi:unnamed protein product [Echinostoma caproni]|uniref:tRNA pseudouridine(13) synthase TruD n=1 Tax=Echinostoma caproni TaxID=27848 RepID=A0A183ACG6_9TREM|nr:unnamed protein product [Echinostoma caproni]